MAIAASIPAHVLFEGLTPGRVAHVLGVTLIFAGFVAWFWRRGLRAYSSASS